MCTDVDKYHKLICQACDPLILLNVTNNTCRLVSFMDEILELNCWKAKQEKAICIN